ncbi:DUF3352 domain-containing protein [Phycicoccus sp. Soil803]|uniref:DUF3352 domain-containing protein n=1 Tax=Phycicoccus sp. Soil803 TaxID=1736415 RepID=UPI000708D8FB|nr:DUF3352 domain-containing protein [Phycicoccus sp. Soil803]KRF23242.1 hypothetical protein ASG95_00520 [Phycicoccus sp. Soil803]
MSNNPFEQVPQPGQQGQPGLFGQPGQQGQPGLFGQPGEPSLFARPAQPTQADPFAAPAPSVQVDPFAQPGAEPVATGRPGRGRTVALVGGILAIVAVGAGGALAFQQVGGGGAQPESALPATTIAFAKIDLDPSAGQKIDGIRFIRKFPDTRDEVKEDSDLRKVIVTRLQAEGQLKGVDYAKDVEPWLGQRIGVGLVPGAKADDEPTVVVALAVTDADEARASLPTIAKDNAAECQLVEEFALCTDGTGKAAGVAAAAAKGTLADSANFRQDMADLGEDGVVAAWFDAEQVAKATRSLDVSGMIPGFTGGPATSQTGRVALALRFDGPHLELAGHTNGASVRFAGSKEGTGLADLPDTTLAAISVANAGEQLKAGWPAMEKAITESMGKQEFKGGVAELESELGIAVPDDLYAALGSQFSLVFGGMGEDHSELRVAAVTDGDRDVLQKISDAGQGLGSGALTLKSDGGTTVVSLSENYADELGTEHGLGDTDRFKDAVKGADSARVAGFVDIAGLLTEFKDEVGADEAKNLAGLSALGFTVTGEGNSADFSLRLTTQ